MPRQQPIAIGICQPGKKIQPIWGALLLAWLNCPAQ